MEGLTIDTGGPEGQPGVAQWRAVCPECGMDNFGPLKPERRARWVVWAVRGLAALMVAGVLVLAWFAARALLPFLR